jgi:hypothetical protein
MGHNISRTDVASLWSVFEQEVNEMIQPNAGLITMAAAAICMSTILYYKERIDSRKPKCQRCGTIKMRNSKGKLICENGHRVIVKEQLAEA